MVTDAKYYSVQQLAEIFSVHENTILKWLNNGTIHGVMMGGVWRVRAEDLPKPEGKE